MQIRLPFANSPHRHLGLPLYTAAVAISHVLPWLLGAGALQTAVLVVAKMTTALGILFWLAHRGGAPCTSCFEQMPLNGTEHAQRRGVWLRHHHRVYETKTRGRIFFSGALVLMLASVALPGLAGRALGDLVIALLLLDFWSSEIHGRLLPWCPQCKRGGGWGEAVEAPTPSTPQTA